MFSVTGKHYGLRGYILFGKCIKWQNGYPPPTRFIYNIELL